MALLVAAQVFFRYVLNNSIFWSEELARYMLVWISFLGATTAYYRGLHPGIDCLVVRLAPVMKRWAGLGVHLVSLTLFGVITVAGVQFAYFIRHQISPALGIEKWIILAVIPVSSTILFVYALTFFLDLLLGVDHDQ